MEIKETLKCSKHVTKHNFYCDSCNKYLGSSEELNDGYYNELGRFSLRFCVDQKWYEAKRCFCDKCKTNFLNMVKENLKNIGFKEDNRYKVIENINRNKPNNCRECVNDKTCCTYYGSNVCQKKWKKNEKLITIV